MFPHERVQTITYMMYFVCMQNVLCGIYIWAHQNIYDIKGISLNKYLKVELSNAKIDNTKSLHFPACLKFQNHKYY